MEKISIIVPIYNVEKYLKDSIMSLINQTYKNLEIILVDDGSPDNSGKICDEYAKKDDRIKVIHKENGGLSDARNFGMKEATGKYLMFLDSDDFFELDACEKLYNEIESKNADYVICNYINTDEDGTKWEKPVFSKEKYKNFKLSINDYEDSFFIMNSAVWNKIFRKDFIDELGIQFEVGLPAEDAIFTTYCFIKSKNVYYIDDVLCNYRQRYNVSISNNCSLKYFEGINIAYKKIYENFKNNDKIGFYRYFYAKSMTYMLCKLIDSSKIELEQKEEVMKKMKWFYKLSDELKVPACQPALKHVVEAIVNDKYDEAIKYCELIKEERMYLSKELREKMSKPDAEMYKVIAKYD